MVADFAESGGQPNNSRSVKGEFGGLCRLPRAVAYIAEVWDTFPPHINDAIGTLIGASIPHGHHAVRPEGFEPDGVAWAVAHQSRSIVQACLREEEWHDVDLEFFEVINATLAEINANCGRDGERRV